MVKTIAKSCFVIFALTFASGGRAAQSTTPQLADAAYQAQKWAEAAAAYEALIKQDPQVAQSHYRLAVALTGLNRHRDAIAHFRKAESLGSPLMQVALRLAAIYGRLGENEAAFAEMKRATDAGLAVIPPQLDADEGFQRLRTDTRYEELVKATERNARPCEHDPKYREFDFWIGEWDVRPAGAPTSPPSTNLITKIHRGCVVLESWTAPNQTGQSFNIYDRSRGKWHQTWVDSTGGLHEYWGELTDGKMVFAGDLPPMRGQTTRQQTRLTFFNLGLDSVRQFSEVTRDGGKTWQTSYDLIYTRKKPS